MSHSEDNQNGGGNGVQREVCTVFTVAYNHHTHVVSFKADGLPISLVQMIVSEVQTQLDIMRRQAAQIELLQRMQQEQEAKKILEQMRGRG